MDATSASSCSRGLRAETLKAEASRVLEEHSSALTRWNSQSSQPMALACSAFMLLETLQFYILWGSIMYIYYCIYIYSLQCIVLYLCLLLCRVLYLCLSRFVKPSQIVTNAPFVMLHAYWVRQLTIIHTYCQNLYKILLFIGYSRLQARQNCKQ